MPDGPVTALVRPESVEVTADPDGAGRVLAASFLGPTARITVALPGDTLVVAQVASARLADLPPETPCGWCCGRCPSSSRGIDRRRPTLEPIPAQNYRMMITDDGDGNRRRIGQTAAEEHSMTRPDWVPEGIDIGRPSAARIYDYWLGGSHNFAVDRELAAQVTAAVPDTAPLCRPTGRSCAGPCATSPTRASGSSSTSARASRRWATCTRWPSSAAPARGSSTSTSTRSRWPTAATILAGNEQRRGHPGGPAQRRSAILAHPEVRGLLDFDQPVAVLMVAVLHFVPDADDRPASCCARLRDALAPGSYLVLSHGTEDGAARRRRRGGRDVYRRTTTPMSIRNRAELTALFDGFELVDPGVVWSAEWRPEHPDEGGRRPGRGVPAYVGVGRRRDRAGRATGVRPGAGRGAPGTSYVPLTAPS